MGWNDAPARRAQPVRNEQSPRPPKAAGFVRPAEPVLLAQVDLEIGDVDLAVVHRAPVGDAAPVALAVGPAPPALLLHVPLALHAERAVGESVQARDRDLDVAHL